jgi:hypothetical protein
VKKLFILWILLLPSLAFGAMPVNPSYVSPTGSGEACTIESPCALSYANANAAAGDLIYLRGGTYATTLAPANSGNCTPPSFPDSCRIRFAAYTAETPIITSSNDGLLIDGKSYIKVDGIKVLDTPFGKYWMMITNGASYNEVLNSTFTQTTTASAYACNINEGSTHNWFHHNTIYNEGPSGTCVEGAGLLKIGSATVGDHTANYNTIEDNTLYHGSHDTLSVHTLYGVYRNNHVYNDGFLTNPGGCYIGPHTGNPSNSKYAHRNFVFDSPAEGGTTPEYNLIEGNRIGYATVNPANEGAEQIVFYVPNHIARYNALYGGDAQGFYFKEGVKASNNHVYNNTLYKNGQYTGPNGDNAIATIAMVFEVATPDQMNKVKNNLMYGNFNLTNPYFGLKDWAQKGGGDPAEDQVIVNNWCDGTVDGVLCTANGDPKFTEPTITDMTSAVLPNLSLQADSDAINRGVSLTTAHGAGSTSSTLIVHDALYFQDGTWGSTLTRILGTLAADWIAIGTVANVHQISSINYATNTITLATTTTWADDAEIWLYKKSDGVQVLYGSAPDYGAYEYVTIVPAVQNIIGILIGTGIKFE